jgi:NAD(P)H-nitrite reductase large subunit
MTTNKKLKIVVVGIGKTGCVLVDNKSKEVNRDDMKFVRIDWGFDESNPNATDIRLPSILPHKTSFEEILEYLEYEGCHRRS